MIRPSPTKGTPVAAAVYLLQRRDRQRFKLGWALNPTSRARMLPEYRRNELDLAASSAIWLPSRLRAEQVERSMHKTLAPYAAKPKHRGTGHSEWFVSTAHPTAVRLLGQMPLDEHTNHPARVVPLESPADQERHDDPQDVWWAVEDLWARLAMCCVVVIEQEMEPLVRFRGARHLGDGVGGVLDTLRRASLDPDRYQCRRGGRYLSFVRWIDFDGDDLVLQMTALHLIERWNEGHDLAWQIRWFLARLASRSNRIGALAGGLDAMD